MIAYESEVDGWTIQTAIEEVKPNGWKIGDPIFYAARGTAEFRAPQRNQGQWKSINRLTYPMGNGQPLFEKSHLAHNDALKFLNAQIDALRQ